MMKKQVWFIRHAESQGNTGEDGGPDPALSKRGREQASHLKGPVDLLIVSPMKRALDTYILSKLSSTSIIVSELFRERLGGGQGEWRLGEDHVKKLERDDKKFVKRVDAAIEFLRAQPEQRIAVISHHTFLAALTGRLYGTPAYLGNAQMIQQTL